MEQARVLFIGVSIPIFRHTQRINKRHRNTLLPIMHRIFAAADDDSAIRISFDNGKGSTKIVEDSNKCYYADDPVVLRFMKFTSMSSDFMNYKFLSSLFDFRNSQDNEVFFLFEKEVLPYIDLDNQLWFISGEDADTNNAGEWWGYLVRTFKSDEIPRSQRTNSFDQRTPLYKNYQDLLHQFNDLLHSKLNMLIAKANVIIKNEFHLESEIILQYKDASFNDRLGNRRFDGELHCPKIYLKASMISDHLVDKSLIEHPRSFFNEAKITCMALALRLAILDNHPTTNEAPSVLFVDDLLISLDMSFRRKIIEILLTYTNKFQTFIFTHDRAFYHLVWSEIGITRSQNKWKRFELYMQHKNGIPGSFILEPKKPLEEAKMHLHNFEISASVNAVRRAAEHELKRLLPANLMYDLKSKTLLCDLNGLIDHYRKFANKIGLPDVIPHLQDERKLLLNPFSHDDIDTPFYRTELELTINEIENLSKIDKKIVVDTEDVNEKEFVFRMEKDGTVYEFIIIFKERFCEYKYEGNRYWNSPKIELKSSCVENIDCKEWELNRFYERLCLFVYHSTDGTPKIIECLRDKVTGDLL